jgi:eukaryotic-like serine/threonine-protein kinase
MGRGDLTRGGTLTNLTRTGEPQWMLWAPDGYRLLLRWDVGGVRQIAALAADGPSTPRSLLRGPFDPSEIHPDGKHVVGAVTTGKSSDIMMMSLDDPAADLRPIVQTAATEQAPTFSPDGAWLAYDSEASGRSEIYVQPYPGIGPRVQVSTDGGMNAAWRRNGRELFFVSLPVGGRMRMMSAALESRAPVRFAVPKPLFDFEFMRLHMACVPVRCYDVSADGQRFFAVQDEPEPPMPPVTQLNIVLNWVEELKARVPVR